MFKVQQNRYLWVHLVGLAAVPLLLDICLAGLASASPAFNYPSAFGLQFWAVALFGIVPTAWMQIQRPFYIYSLPPLALKPSVLSEEDRRGLTVLTSWQIKALSGVTALFLIWLLTQVYARLSQVSPIMGSTAGLVSAIASFFFICLFLQISVSVVRSLLIGQDTLQRVKPFEASEVSTNFLMLGLRVRKIFPTEVAITETQADSTRTATKQRKPLTTAKSASEKAFSKQIETPAKIEDIADETKEETVALDPVEAEDRTVEKLAESALTEDPDEVEVVESELVKTLEAETEADQKELPLVVPEIIESDKIESDDNR